MSGIASGQRVFHIPAEVKFVEIVHLGCFCGMSCLMSAFDELLSEI